MVPRTLLCLLLVEFSTAFKFLAVIPRQGKSHVNFMTRISESLIDAGHEVVILSAVFDSRIGNGTERARIYQVPQSLLHRGVEEMIANMGGLVSMMWEASRTMMTVAQYEPFVRAGVEQCNDTFAQPGLIEALRAEKFDAAYAETLDYCAFALFHVLGIEKYAVTMSVSTLERQYFLTQAPTTPSYVPSLISDSFSDKMTFWERLWNAYTSLYIIDLYSLLYFDCYNELLRSFDASFPSIQDLLARSSYVFFNSDPYTDFPRPISHKIVDIGGISVAHGAKPLNATWSSIMDLRPRTILISFGTFAESHQMPEAFKKTIQETVKAFLDVTFIWKYEKPEHGISTGIDNLVESTWIPQNDMLGDARLTAFITHGGQGSITEANNAGVPLIVIPVISDQGRNAKQVERNGVGIIVEKAALRAPGPLATALKELLGNPTYGDKAKQLASVLADRPFSSSELFVRHMQFLAAHGPLRQLDHYGARLNFFQYYLIDVAAFVVFIVVTSLSLVFTVLMWSFMRICRVFSSKSKKE